MSKQAKITISVLVMVLVVVAVAPRGGNPLAIIAGLLVLALAVCWIIFPVIVISKFNELLDVQRKSLDQQRENAKALQWLVDKSKSP